MKKLPLMISTIILLLIKNSVLAQVLSWFSQLEHEMGLVANADFNHQKLSSNVRNLTFVSDIGNQVADDYNDGDDVFIKDFITRDINRASEMTGGSEVNTVKVVLL